MARLSRVRGVGNIVKNLKSAQKPIVDRVMGNVVKAGLYVQRDSQQRVPVNTGNLKNTAFTRRTKAMEVVVGYTAAYALFVHENVEMKLKGQERPRTRAGTYQGRYWDPQGKGQAKFLENAFKENMSKLRNIVKGGASK